ncbi:MAG: alpha-L-arabinofuranosidase C-terminal domain-containing protein [Candidatus Fimenecus sp.]
MLKKGIAFALTLLLLLCTAQIAFAAKPDVQAVTVDADNISHDISNTLYGAFIEDINFAVEGGLNANLVRNNSFEYLHGDEKALSGWTIDGQYIRKVGSGISENNPAYIYMPDAKDRAVKNYGFCEYYDYKTKHVNQKSIDAGSMGIKAGEAYTLSLWFKETDTTVTAFLENNQGEKLSDTVTFRVQTDVWAKYTVDLSAAKTDGGILVLKFGTGDVTFDFVCLYPQKSYGYGTDTWKYTSLRQDLFDALYALHPAFLRFPGGCVAEGDSLENLFNWKDTVGPLESRKQFHNLWRNAELDYNNSFSVGYHEYFQLCEDLGAAPVPILNVGLICQARCGYDDTYAKYKSGEMTAAEWEDYLDTIALRPGTSEWDDYVQDILDLIEYANGDVSTEWGAKRAENGHPAPFGLSYIGLGNENWGEVYFRNLQALKAAVNEKYPDITVITSAGPVSSGEQFDKSWEILSKDYADTIVDEHYYQDDWWYLENTDRYDSYDRDGAKVFLGEYAATARGVGTIQTKSNLKAALSEAAYMTSLEKNGDVVVMASYAPLLAKSDAEQWNINLIWFDAYNVVLTPSYYTQMLYMNNTGTKYVKTDLPDGNDGVYQSVTVDPEQELLYVKLVNTTGEKKAFTYDFAGFGQVQYADVLTLSDRSAAACNELGKTTIVPTVKKVENIDTPTVEAAGYSVNILRIAYGNNTKAEGLYKLPKMPDTSKYYTPLERALVIAIPAAVVVLAAGTCAVVYIRRKKKQK